MLDVLKQDKLSVLEFTTALSAIQKWGSWKEQETEYTRALQNPRVNESSKYFAIILFREFRSEPIRSELCDLLKNALDQNVRLTAAETIVPYQAVSNIDCLKKIVVESYEPA